MSKIISAISKLLTQAREAGASPQQINNLRQGFKMQYDWSPTKTKASPAKRKRLRKIQKQSRRVNRGANRG